MENPKTHVTKKMDAPDERRDLPAHGHVDVCNLPNDVTIGRVVFEPGWKWSNDVKPLAGTPSCQEEHAGYCLEGNIKVKMDSGKEFEIHAGEAYYIPPGHDGEVIGDKPFVALDFIGMKDYAKRKAKAA